MPCPLRTWLCGALWLRLNLPQLGNTTALRNSSARWSQGCRHTGCRVLGAYRAKLESALAPVGGGLHQKRDKALAGRFRVRKPSPSGRVCPVKVPRSSGSTCGSSFAEVEVMSVLRSNCYANRMEIACERLHACYGVHVELSPPLPLARLCVDLSLLLHSKPGTVEFPTSSLPHSLVALALRYCYLSVTR